MELATPRPSVPGSVAFLSVVNGVLFVIGALLHMGVLVGPLQEPVVVPAMMVESICTIALGVVTMGIFTRAMWAHRLAVFSNALALAGVGAVALILAFDSRASTTGNTVLQISRAALALICLGRLRRAPHSAARF